VTGNGRRKQPPATAAGRETDWVASHTHETRDATPALGTPAEPASWRPGDADEDVALARPAFGDARWSYLFGGDTRYAADAADRDAVAEAARRMRGGELPHHIQGPVIHAPVWTWEVPLYFWLGGVAAGASFVALACDLAGDHRSAQTARRVAIAAVVPAPPLLVADLGRPGRFLNMLRVFKPRSAMNAGAWCLVSFSAVEAAAVGADLAGRERAARSLGGAGAVLGGYLGSYTAVLLATTAVPLWARSRLLLGPIFVATATATGAAATRLALVASGLPSGHPTRNALGTVETGAMATELVLSTLNKRRLGHLARALEEGRPGRLFRAAELAVGSGLALRFARRRLGPRAHHVASVLYLAGGLAFRYAWIEAGKASARDDEAVARMARGQATVEDRVAGDTARHEVSRPRRARPAGPLARGYPEAVRRASLMLESLRPGQGGGRAIL
jgi:formate-dependent nitrite reductase membrane component NrfD